MSSETVYVEVEQVVRETFALWDVTRVGFSWRKYYLDHTRQDGMAGEVAFEHGARGGHIAPHEHAALGEVQLFDLADELEIFEPHGNA